MKHIISLITLICMPFIKNEEIFVTEDNYCRSPLGGLGICINIRYCTSLLNLLRSASQDPETTNFLKRSKCGGYGEVCCPMKGNRKSNISHANESSHRVDGCGKTTVMEQEKIVGGTESTLGAWPWIAVLGYRGKHGLIWGLCAGSLINNRYVLTAAHCKTVKLTKVRLGEHNLHSEFDGASPVDFSIEKIIVHNNYSRNKRPPTNDIALIRLDKNVLFNDKIKPVCLPQAADLRSNFDRKYPFVIGWGSIKYRGPSSDVLRQVQVPIVQNERCGKAYEKLGDIASSAITENHICAGEMKGGKDSCQGDSGGPLLLPQNQTYYQIGIVSYGHECATPGFPGVYTRITSYLDWINNNIE